MQKRSWILLAAATIGLTASQALAADLPRKAPPPAVPMAPPVTWTGCYIGGNVGGIFGRGDAHFNTFEVGSNERSGFTGGGQIGCDYQFAGGWVIGIRNMFNGTSLSRDTTFVDPVTLNSVTVSRDVNWFDTLTGRIGYAFAPGWLLYGQGGVAWAKASADVTVNGFSFGDFSKTATGWTAGGGVEWMFARGWSVFLEGNYMDFGDNDHTVFGVGPVVCPVGGCNFTTHVKAATVLVGVNYRFGGFGKAPY
jgi:outer membrane immunogenic protein